MFMNQRPLVQGGALGTGVSAIYTVPANTTTRITAASFCNTTDNARTVTVHLVKAGESPSAANMVINQYVVGPRETWTSPHLSQVLSAGDTIQAAADVANALVPYVSGVEMSR